MNGIEKVNDSVNDCDFLIFFYASCAICFSAAHICWNFSSFCTVRVPLSLSSKLILKNLPLSRVVTSDNFFSAMCVLGISRAHVDSPMCVRAHANVE